MKDRLCNETWTKASRTLVSRKQQANQQALVPWPNQRARTAK
jgi:hypothetical protein